MIHESRESNEFTRMNFLGDPLRVLCGSWRNKRGEPEFGCPALRRNGLVKGWNPMEPPIIAVDGHDVTIFESVQEAEGYIEYHDVDVYRIFDAEGYVIHAKVRDQDWTVYLVQDEAGLQDEAALREILVGFVYHCDQEAKEIENLPLAELVERAWHYGRLQPFSLVSCLGTGLVILFALFLFGCLGAGVLALLNWLIAKALRGSLLKNTIRMKL